MITKLFKLCFITSTSLEEIEKLEEKISFSATYSALQISLSSSEKQPDVTSQHLVMVCKWNLCDFAVKKESPS